MPSRRSTSPSPPPPVPVELTPGARASALYKVFANAIASTVKANSYENFSACFPTPAQFCPTALEAVWKKLNIRLEENCLREFEVILNERRVVEGLNQWDGIVDEARRRMNRGVQGEEPGKAPHTLSGFDLYNAYLTPYLTQATHLLELQLQKSQDDNKKFMEKIHSQRAELEQLVNGLENVVRDIDGSVEIMDSKTESRVEGLRPEIWAMEQEVCRNEVTS